NLVLRAEAHAAALALEGQVLAAGPAQVDFAPGMCATGAFDRGGAVLVAVRAAEDGIAGGAFSGAGGVLHFGEPPFLIRCFIGFSEERLCPIRFCMSSSFLVSFLN